MLALIPLFAFLLLPLFSIAADLQIDKATCYSHSHGGRALIIWQGRQTILEDYVHGGGIKIEENAYSMTKSICAMGIFAAADRGCLNLDEKASTTLTKWKQDPLKADITLRELLNQTSGLAPGYSTIYSKNVCDKNRAALHQPVIGIPGKTFVYGPVHYESLEAILDKKLANGPATPLVFVKSSILSPLGIEPGQWREDHNGHPFFSAGAHLTARDLLKIGQLVLNDGHILGFLPLFSSKYLKEAKLGSETNPMYGMGLWLNRNANQENATERDVEQSIDANLCNDDWARNCLSRHAPTDLIAMVGSHGQRVYIVPSQKLVIVRTGHSDNFRDPEFLGLLFQEQIRLSSNL